MRFQTLFIIAICVLGSYARPAFAPLGETVETPSPRRYVMQKTTSRDIERGEEDIAYDITLSDKVVLLDQQEILEEVICNPKETTLVFQKGKRLNLEVGQILYGGPEWGCVHPEHSAVLPFNRRILAIAHSFPELDSYTYVTEVVKLTELFAAANVAYTNALPEEPIVQPIPTVLEAQRRDVTEIDDASPPEEEGRERRGSDKLVIGEIGDLFFAGDTITVPYSFDNSISGKKFEVCLRKKRLVLDKDISCQTITLTSYGKGEVNFAVLASYEASSAYYVKFDGKWLFAPSFSSLAIGINPATLLLTPDHSSEFYRNTVMEVTWYAHKDHKNKVAELTLVKNGLINKNVQSWQLPLGNNKLNINVNDLPKGADSGTYFFKLTYGCFVGDLFCDLYDVSDEFSLTRELPGTKTVTITSPAEGDVYLSGRTLSIKWATTAMLTSDKVKISVCRDTYGLDACPYRNAETSNTGSYSLTVPSSWRGSSQYYVVVQYNCKLFWCSSRESRRFSLNYTPQFEWLSPTPAADSMITAPATVTAKFSLRSGATVKKTKSMYLRLMRQVPFLDLVHDGASTELLPTAGEKSFNINAGTVFPVRFMIAYDCKFLGYFCQREYSPVFSIPTTYSKGWNYDSNSDKAAERKTLFAISCNSCGDDKTNLFCKACGKVPGLQSSIEVACTNCYLTSTVKMYDFMLNVNLLGVTGASLAVTGAATANFDMLVQFDASYSIAKEFELARYSLIGTSFNVGPIKVNLGVSLALNTTLEFSVSGVAKVTAGFDATVEFKAISSYGGIKGDSNDVSFGLTKFNKHTPTLDLRVDVYGKAGLKPVFDINAIDLLRFWVALHPYVDLTAKFQVPAFRPGPYPDEKTLAKLGIDCHTLDHFSEYDLRVHIEANMYAAALSKNWSSPIWTLLNKSLVCGCLFPSRGPLSAQDFTVAKPLTALNHDEDSFRMALLQQLTEIVFPDKGASRFDISFPPVDSTNKFAVDTFNVKVTAFQTDNPYENINLKELNGMITNTLSNFYQNDFGKSLKGLIGLYSA